MCIVFKLLKWFFGVFVVVVIVFLIIICVVLLELLQVGDSYVVKIVCFNVFLVGCDVQMVLVDDVQVFGNLIFKVVMFDVDKDKGKVIVCFFGYVVLCSLVY